MLWVGDPILVMCWWRSPGCVLVALSLWRVGGSLHCVLVVKSLLCGGSAVLVMCLQCGPRGVLVVGSLSCVSGVGLIVCAYCVMLG